MPSCVVHEQHSRSPCRMFDTSVPNSHRRTLLTEYLMYPAWLSKFKWHNVLISKDQQQSSQAGCQSTAGCLIVTLYTQRKLIQHDTLCKATMHSVRILGFTSRMKRHQVLITHNLRTRHTSSAQNYHMLQFEQSSC